MTIENCLGLDFETTGLDPALDGILEIGARVIAPNFDSLAEIVIYVKQPDIVLARMIPAVRAQHERSGLLAKCEAEGLEPETAFANTYTFARKWFPEGRAILLGSSIHFDRNFIKARMTDLEKLLHYRMIDTSSIREAVRIFGSPHRTMADLDVSVDSLRAFMGRLK